MSFLKKSIIIISVFSLIFISQNLNVKALEIQNDENIEITPKSGGVVSITYSKPSYTLVDSYYKYAWLTDNWAKVSSYVVSKKVSFTSSFTTTAGVSVSIPSSVESSLKTSISYGVSVSTSYSINSTIPANSSKNSKLRYKAKMKKYKVKYNVITKYYDTSTGYYTKTQAYERYAIVPQTNDTYIYVYYQ